MPPFFGKLQTGYLYIEFMPALRKVLYVGTAFGYEVVIKEAEIKR